MGIPIHTMKFESSYLYLLITFALGSCELSEENIGEISDELEILMAEKIAQLKTEASATIDSRFEPNVRHARKILKAMEDELDTDFVDNFKQKVVGILGSDQGNIDKITDAFKANLSSNSLLMKKIKSQIVVKVDSSSLEEQKKQLEKIIQLTFGAQFKQNFKDTLKALLNENTSTAVTLESSTEEPESTTMAQQDESRGVCPQQCHENWCTTICVFRDANDEVQRKPCKNFN